MLCHNTLRMLNKIASKIVRSTEKFSKGQAGNNEGEEIQFYRLDNVLLAPEWSFLCKKMAGLVEHLNINKAVLLDSRGYLFAQIAVMLDIGIVKACKNKKLSDMSSITYETEYSESTLYVLNDVIGKGDRVLIIDDLLATGGSINAVEQLVTKLGGTPVAALVAMDIEDITKKKCTVPIYSMFQINSGEISWKDFDRVELSLTDKDLVDDRTVVMSHYSARSLADSIIDTDTSKFRYGHISWHHFNDKYPNITFDHNLENRDVIFVMSMHDPAIYMEQLSVIMVLPRQGINSLRIIMGYFAPGTMDRVDCEGIVATAETAATILSSCIPMTKTGPATLEIYDIHALQERFYFKDKVRVKLRTATHLIKEKCSPDEFTIVFPDDGAAKRYGQDFEDYDTIICSKVRDGNKRTITIKDTSGPIKTHSFLIVDDLVQSGGTLLSCAKMLRNAYPGNRVHAFVTHAIFPQHGYRKFMESGVIDEFHCTNTNPYVTDILKRIDMFDVIDLGSDLAGVSRDKNPNHVYVASKNIVKLKAVHYGTKVELPRVFGIDVGSGVKEQPINDETTKGALNRWYRLRKLLETEHKPYCEIWSLENGIYIENDGGAYDVCRCVKDPAICHMLSDTVEVPDYAIKICKENEYNITCGDIIEKENGWKSGSWHKKISGRTRLEIMCDMFMRMTHVSNVDRSYQM